MGSPFKPSITERSTLDAVFDTNSGLYRYADQFLEVPKDHIRTVFLGCGKRSWRGLLPFQTKTDLAKLLEWHRQGAAVRVIDGHLPSCPPSMKHWNVPPLGDLWNEAARNKCKKTGRTHSIFPGGSRQGPDLHRCRRDSCNEKFAGRQALPPGGASSKCVGPVQKTLVTPFSSRYESRCEFDAY